MPRHSLRRLLLSAGRRSRQNSVTSLDLALEENSSEMFAGAASEIIPSSISSFHYPHHFGAQKEILRETSPLLDFTRLEYGVQDLDLTRVTTHGTNASGQGDAASVNFRFFSPEQIESAPGGSTLENPQDPVDYNTNWDYNVDKFEDSDEEDRRSRSRSVSLRRRAESSYRASFSKRVPRSPYIEGEESRYETIIDDRNRRRSSASEHSSTESRSLGGDLEQDAFLKDYTPTSQFQRYYLAEEDIVIGIAGYRSSLRKSIVYYALCFCTLGVAYLVLRWMPRYRINLRGTPCALGFADWCVIENEYGELAIVNIQRLKYGERLSHFAHISPEDDEETNSFKESDPVVPMVLMFEYRYNRFFYHPVKDIFCTNSSWYDKHWLNVTNLREGTSPALHEQRTMVFGTNTIEIQEKSNLNLLADEVLHPFYVFQIFSIFLWLADDYYYYASCIFIISVVSILNSLVETKSNIRRLLEMSKFSCDVRVWRNGFWTQADSITLVPGDVFEVDPSLLVAPCDALLINGECVVNESMLTGESVPVSKTAATEETVQYLTESFTHPQLAKSFLYNGTRILKMKSTNEEPVLAMAVKTGFNTTKGSLVRSMLFPKPVGFKFYEDSFKYIGFMTLIAFLGFIYSTYNFIKLGLSTRIIVLRALDIVTIVVPPALPATLTIGTSFAVSRLKSKKIFCIAPTRINIGGKIDVACFDKTGTLTEDGLDVLGVHTTRNAEGRKEIIFEKLAENIDILNEPVSLARQKDSSSFLLGCMAACHSLRLIDDELVGDPLDEKMFEFTNWKFADEFGGNQIPIVFSNPGHELLGYKIVQEFEFVAALRRMSVVVEKDNVYLVFTKGAPEAIAELCDPMSIPSDYDELLHHYTRGGFRVIACAYKTLSSRKNLHGNNRKHAEKNLTFTGFIVFENKLKASTKPTLLQLRDSAIRTVMCTGDNVLTAVSVGRECGLIGGENTLVFMPKFAPDENWEATGGTGLVWENIADSNQRLDPLTLQEVTHPDMGPPGDVVLAITGDVFRYMLTELQKESVIQQVLMKGSIFARMSPDEKHELVQQLQKLDYTVCFCGDGANDCGALKAADVGISLSEAEASVAAPFTSRVFEISCVLDVIREGRSSLVTSFSCFRYMSLYSAIQFVTVTILYKRGSNLGDFQFLYVDLFLILPLAVFMSWAKPYPKIAAKRPTANLVSPKVLIPLLGQIAVILVFQVVVWLWVQTQPWYVKPVPSDDDDHVELSDNTILFLYANFQYILYAVVLSKGPPYREAILKNMPFLINVLLAVLLSVAIFAIDENTWWGHLMLLTNMSTTAYVVVSVLGVFNLGVSVVGEEVWFPGIARLYKRHMGTTRSKKLFKNLRGGVQSV